MKRSFVLFTVLLVLVAFADIHAAGRKDKKKKENKKGMY